MNEEQKSKETETVLVFDLLCDKCLLACGNCKCLQQEITMVKTNDND